MSRYDSIINLPHKQSSVRKRMPISDRAAQFAPFAALTGYEEAVKETARLTDLKIEQTEHALDMLNQKITNIKEIISDQPVVKITYFVPDSRKQGGKYETYTGRLRLIDETFRMFVFTDGRKINMDDITDCNRI